MDLYVLCNISKESPNGFPKCISLNSVLSFLTMAFRMESCLSTLPHGVSREIFSHRTTSTVRHWILPNIFTLRWSTLPFSHLTFTKIPDFCLLVFCFQHTKHLAKLIFIEWITIIIKGNIQNSERNELKGGGGKEEP